VPRHGLLEELFFVYDNLHQKNLKAIIHMEEEIRKEAISRYLKDEQPKSIYNTLQRSKKWFFKWLKRYKSGVAPWYKEQS
jgi:hypothetical protein